MWDLRVVNPFDFLSIRKILLFVATVMVAVFAYILATAPTTYAADATWNGESITYDGNQYIRLTDAESADGSALFPDNQAYYGRIDSSNTAHLIIFEPDADLATTTSVEYAQYDFTPPNTYTNQTNAQTISIDTQTPANQAVKSCHDQFLSGIGWIVCPITNTLAGAMDWLFNVLSGFLTVRPAQTNQDSALYRAWSFMRNFANIAFVIGFLVLIYSQLTSMGISNYGIKKTLPRLIIAAILVNVSYWVCAIAIDASNIFGYALQDIFIGMRNAIVGGDSNSWDVVSWQSVAGFILSGGTATAALGIGAFGVLSGTVGGAIFLFIPIIVGVLMAVLVALLIMAARQAIITVLVILAPLAFVAYLLPNTEKYFDKWRGLFMTMLLVFPMFSVLFGGAQLAGTAIIQNANSINLIILGMATQVAPVVVTPFLIKFSGSLLGRIAGMVNNPNRGAIDRTRKWAQERAGQHKDRVLGSKNARGISKATQGINNRRRRREDRQKLNQSRADNLYRGTDKYAAIEDAVREANRDKQILDNTFESNWNIKARLDTSSIEKELQMRVTGDEASKSKLRLDAMHEETKAGIAPHFGPQTESMVDILNRSQDTARDLALTSMRKQAAESTQKSQLASDLLANTKTVDGRSIQDYAGGIDEHGANSALATAVSIDRKQYNDRVTEASAILKHFNLSGAQRQDHAMGKGPITLRDDNGNVKVLDNDSTFTREAAIEAQLGGAGNMQNIEEIIMNSGGTLDEFKTTISEGIVKNGIAQKAAYWGGKSIDEVAQGKINGPASVKFVTTRAIAQGKIKPVSLSTMDQVAIQNIQAAAKAADPTGLSPDDASALRAQIHELQKSAYEALHSDNLRGNVAQNVEPILRDIVGDYTPPAPSSTP